MGHSNTTEAFLKAICTKLMLFFSFFFLVNWVIVRIKKKKSVIVSMNKRVLKTSKT